MTSHCVDCGDPCSYKSQRCMACSAQFRRGPSFHCEWCGTVFWRKKLNHDDRRFCSQRCSGLFRAANGELAWQTPEAEIRRAISLARLHEARSQQALVRRQERLQQREEQRREREAQKPTCSCGAPYRRRRWTPDHPFMRYWCDSCFEREFHELSHICPNCGQTFQGERRAVYCSPRCSAQFCKRVERGTVYSHIGRLPLNERNKLAEYLALIRMANIRIYRSA